MDQRRQASWAYQVGHGGHRGAPRAPLGGGFGSSRAPCAPTPAKQQCPVKYHTHTAPRTTAAAKVWSGAVLLPTPKRCGLLCLQVGAVLHMTVNTIPAHLQLEAHALPPSSNGGSEATTLVELVYLQ